MSPSPDSADDTSESSALQPSKSDDQQSSSSDSNATYRAIAVVYLILGITSLSGDDPTLGFVWLSLGATFWCIGISTKDVNHNSEAAEDPDSQALRE